MKKVLINRKYNYWAYEDGTIRKGNEPLPVRESWFDSDMDLWWEAEPFVYVDESGRRIFAEDAMRAAGFVNGDKSTLQSPVILHRDNDFRNMASDNLEWVESDDPRYVEYAKRKHKDREARYKELNKTKVLPDFPYWH